jgi:hypothetical protein
LIGDSGDERRATCEDPNIIIISSVTVNFPIRVKAIPTTARFSIAYEAIHTHFVNFPECVAQRQITVPTLVHAKIESAPPHLTRVIDSQRVPTNEDRKKGSNTHQRHTQRQFGETSIQSFDPSIERTRRI